jgi:hypothetical protein
MAQSAAHFSIYEGALFPYIIVYESFFSRPLSPKIFASQKCFSATPREKRNRLPEIMPTVPCSVTLNSA